MKLSTHQWPAAKIEHNIICPLWTTVSPQRLSGCILTRGDQQPLQVGYFVLHSLEILYLQISERPLVVSECTAPSGHGEKVESRSPWQTKLTLIVKRRANAINFYQKITESPGREGSPRLHHSVRFCFGRSALNPSQLVISQSSWWTPPPNFWFWLAYTITSFRQKCPLTSG